MYPFFQRKRHCLTSSPWTSIIFLVDQIFQNVYISLRRRKSSCRRLINSPCPSVKLNNNLLGFILLTACQCTETPRNFLCSGQHPSCLKEKVYLHSHCFNTSWALWFLSCRASVLGNISVSSLVKRYVLTWNLRAWMTYSVAQWCLVCLRLNSCLMQLCKPMQMSSCHFSWLLGRINPKNDFFYKNKQKSWIGLDEINIFIRENVYILNENLFLEREIYLYVVIFSLFLS